MQDTILQKYFAAADPGHGSNPGRPIAAGNIQDGASCNRPSRI